MQGEDATADEGPCVAIRKCVLRPLDTKVWTLERDTIAEVDWSSVGLNGGGSLLHAVTLHVGSP